MTMFAKQVARIVDELRARWGHWRLPARHMNGGLVFKAGLAEAHYPVGDFVVHWQPHNGGCLSVTHTRQPEKLLWSSLPGRSFVAAAQGHETVVEARGMFFFSDRKRARCTEQTINEIRADAGTVTISGVLRSRRGSVGYVLSLHPYTSSQLGLILRLDNPAFNRTYLTYASSADECFFGFGMQFSFFDFKGRRLPIFVMEQGIGRGAQPITLGANLQAQAGGDWWTTYACTPQYITSQLRSLCLDSYAYAVFDLRRARQVQIELFAGELSGRILYGETPAQLIETYTAFAGRMRPLPEWIHTGAVVGMQGGTARVRQVWQALQARQTPIAAFWLQDWVGQRTTSFGKQLWWNWELDHDRYPGWNALVDDLRSAGIHVLSYINPFLADCSDKTNLRRNLFAEAAAQGFLVADATGNPYTIRITDFSAAPIDLSNPAAREWLKEVIRVEALGSGVSGWMADFGEGLPYDAQLHSGEAAAIYHNRYPEEWARLNRELIDEQPDAANLLCFFRSGYRHSPRYATLFWLGDQLVSWDAYDGIKTAVIGLLSSGMSGFSLNHSDIGGYTAINHPLRNYHRSKELLLRWMELNAFTAVYRTHEGNRPEVNTQFYSDEETLAHFSRFAKVYQAWGFYRKELLHEAATTGLPVVRHPFIHYPDDTHVRRLSYQQFMVGSEFMVAPVLDPRVRTATVYLPAGRWIHLWSGAPYGSAVQGATVTVAAPLGQPGIWYRHGSDVAAQFVEALRYREIL